MGVCPIGEARLLFGLCSLLFIACYLYRSTGSASIQEDTLTPLAANGVVAEEPNLATQLALIALVCMRYLTLAFYLDPPRGITEH